MSKARTLANLISDNAELADGQISVAEVVGAAPTANPTFTGNVSLGDNDKAIFGAGSDLQIYHDGSNSWIKDEGTGVLAITTNGNGIGFYDPTGTEPMLFATKDNSVDLYFNGSKKLATTSTGVDVTGTITSDGLSVDGGTIKLDGNYPVGTDNVALGDTALDSNVSGASNTAIGADALTANTASNNTAVGYQAAYSNTTGSTNTAVGSFSLLNSTVANGNSAFGYASGRDNTTGGNLSAFGYFALESNTTGSNNVAVGTEALTSNTTADANTAVGYQAMYSGTTAQYSTAVGWKSLHSVTNSEKNVAFGVETLENTTTGGYNTALGTQALRLNTTASYNTAVGYQAGYSQTTGQYNLFVGSFAGYSSTGTGNTFVGAQTAGYGCGDQMTTGSKNTILGAYNGNQGGLDIRTSNNNIVLSDGDGNPRVYVNGSGRVMVSQVSTVSNAQFEVSSTDGNVSSFNANSIYHSLARFQYASTTNVGSITTNGSSTAYNTTSDYRLKENVVELTGATDRLKQIPVHKFNFISHPDTTVDGFLAHEVQAVVPEAVTGEKDAVDADGNPEYQGIDQSKLVPLLVATIQELEARITALENA